MALAMRGLSSVVFGRLATEAARCGGRPSLMRVSSFRILRHVGRVAIVMAWSLRQRGFQERALSVGSPVEVFAIRLAALVNLGPSDASDAVCAELDGWPRVTYDGGESSTGYSLLSAINPRSRARCPNCIRRWRETRGLSRFPISAYVRPLSRNPATNSNFGPAFSRLICEIWIVIKSLYITP